jgi:hypothetical protein
VINAYFDNEITETNMMVIETCNFLQIFQIKLNMRLKRGTYNC